MEKAFQLSTVVGPESTTSWLPLSTTGAGAVWMGRERPAGNGAQGRTTETEQNKTHRLREHTHQWHPQAPHGEPWMSRWGWASTTGALCSTWAGKTWLLLGPAASGSPEPHPVEDPGRINNTFLCKWDGLLLTQENWPSPIS